jgi:hypothetical protein
VPWMHTRSPRGLGSPTRSEPPDHSRTFTPELPHTASVVWGFRVAGGMSRILVLSCSGKKFSTPAAVPAWYRYDGMLFRVCKRLEAAGRFPHDVHVLILSAEFGLLRRDALIPWYDRPLNAARADALKPAVTLALHTVLTQNGANEIFLAMGMAYRRAIGTLPTGVAVIDVREPIGLRMERLRVWLSPTDQQLRIPFDKAAT